MYDSYKFDLIWQVVLSNNKVFKAGKHKAWTRVTLYTDDLETLDNAFHPYWVEDIMCENCKQPRCSCPVKLHHVDPKGPHCQDLCGRCKGKCLSCDNTFSFKRII